MDLSQLTLRDIYGAARIPLSGTYTAGQLADKMVEEWLPYWECHKCGRFDYCKFVERLPHNPARARDIKCGVAATAIRLFVEKTFPLLRSMTRSQVQDYLDAAYYFSQFVLDAEVDIGGLISRPHVDYWTELGPQFFTSFLRLRDHLDPLADKLRALPDFTFTRPVLFVEGEAEEAFLETLRESHLSHFLHLRVEVYGGSGNRRPKRVEMLLANYARRGYTVYIQGDADGSNGSIFQALVDREHVTTDRTFVFPYDFETAIPPGLLHAALTRLGQLSGTDMQAFLEAYRARGDRLMPWLRSKYDVDPHKVSLAQTVARLLNENDRWWMDNMFMQTDLGRFLDFVRRL